MEKEDQLETEIRRALAVEARAVEAPEGLTERTLEAADREPPTVRGRMRARLGRGERIRGYPRWTYAAAAVVLVAAVFGVGQVVTDSIDVPSEDTLDGPDTSGPELPGAEPLGERAVGVEEERGLLESEQAPEDFSSPVEPPIPPLPGRFPPELIRTAELDIEVRRGRLDDAFNRARQIATSSGGFVTAEQHERFEQGIGRGTVTLRVPAPRMDDALSALRRLGNVQQLTASTQDVSGQLVDLGARVRALQAQEAQLLELLDRADDVSDVLEIRTRLDEVRMEIERLQAQRQHLENQVEMSQITVSLHERGAPALDDPEGPFADAWETALRVALTIFAGLIVVVGFLVPFALIGFMLWLGVRVVGRRTV